MPDGVFQDAGEDGPKEDEELKTAEQVKVEERGPGEVFLQEDLENGEHQEGAEDPEHFA